ncbi:MAG TPA: hypothetical protein VLD63_15260 [Anaerolineales bacterium]|nr:hypothetical protein [Anaerolineales bacterium]
MLKTLKIAIPMALVVALNLGVVPAFAQVDTPQSPAGWGRHGGVGLLAAYDETIHQALADALGISLEEFESARDDGQTLAELAAAHDVDLADLFQVMETARAEAIAEAVAQGNITQAQADWLLDRPVRRGGLGLAIGQCDGRGPTVGPSN